MIDLFEADISYLKLNVEDENLDEAISNAYYLLKGREENSENMIRMFYHLFRVIAEKMERDEACAHTIFDHFLEGLGALEKNGEFDPTNNIGLDNSEAIAFNMILAQIAERMRDEQLH